MNDVSPALASADPNSCTGADQLGNARIAPCDIGAVESGGTAQTHGVISFASSNFEGSEGSTVVLTLSRSQGSDGEVSVLVRTRPGSATGSDYESVSTRVTWGDGDTADKTLSLNLSSDGTVAATKRFHVDLHAPDGGATLGATDSATVSIQDTSTVTIELSGHTSQLKEDFTPHFTVAIVAGEHTVPVTVNYSTVDGTALAGEDYTGLSGTLTWDPSDNAPKTVSIPLLDDSEIEDLESFGIQISDPGVGARLGSWTEGTITIEDNDTTSIGIITPAGVDENGGEVVLTISRYGPTDKVGKVSYRIEPGLATPGSDYQIASSSGTLVFAEGEQTKTLTVRIIDDDAEEGDESFSLTIESLDGTLLRDDKVWVTIRDDDDCPEGYTCFTVEEESSGGGGTTEWAWLLSLGSLLLWRRKIAADRLREA